MKRAPLWQLSVTTSADAEEAVGELLSRVLAEPVSVFANEETKITTFTAYCQKAAVWNEANRRALRRGLRELAAGGLDPRPGRITFQKLPAENWAESWKRHFKPLAIGSALLIKPSWSRRQPRQGQAVLVLDPGLSFGTGQHATTSFCLRQLVACRARGAAGSFLDLGTGSGILALAAARLGYAPVVGLDFDPEAVRAARANAKSNRLEAGVLLRQQDLTRLPRRSRTRYRLVCANLIYDLLLAESTRILNRLHAEGTLVLAGILTTQFAQVQQHYEQAGLRLLATRVEKEWQSGAFVRVG